MVPCGYGVGKRAGQGGEKAGYGDSCVRREIELGGESQKALTRNVTTLSGYFSSDLRFSCPQVAGFRATCFPGRQAEYLKMWKAECARARPRVSDPAVQCTVSQPISLLFILSDEPNASDI